MTHPILPELGHDALLIGRIWDPSVNGPRPVAISNEQVHDLTAVEPTISGLLERDNPAALVREALAAPAKWRTTDLALAAEQGRTDAPRFIAPIDLQVIKACGVTFVDSMVERVIEERTGGDAVKAGEIRAQITEAIGSSLAELKPGSEAAAHAKQVLQEQGLWSQYLEVGIGPDPEVFSKAPVLSAVGYGASVGIASASKWNNPEPELVLIVNSRGEALGATLGNDVNLRDIEGRSALLLGKAKDNNASSSLGPFIRLFEEGRGESFTLDVLRSETIDLSVTGTDGYELQGRNSLSRISRSFEELIGAAYGRHHQYPDGFALFTGTLFAPTEDRDHPGQGFTHKIGDVVRIISPHLGTLLNPVGISEELPPWTFGIAQLIRHLRSLDAA